MSFRDARLRTLVLAAVLLVPALPGHALPHDGPARVRDDRGAFTVFVDELRSFWRGLIEPHGSRGVTMKEGMSIDPHGGNSNPGATTDEGMLIDPHG